MSFRVGDKVVYPQHGATVIDGIETLDALARPASTWFCGSPTLT